MSPPADPRAHPPADDGPTRTAIDPLARLAPGQLLAGRYRILGLVGAGGMGVVYRARDEQLGIEVAVKLLRPEQADRRNTRERFVKELILARQVSHRNVVRIHDLGRDGDLEFLTMDLVEGRSLRELLREEGPLPPARAVALARQLADALAAAHDEGVVHRDLKPDNVLVAAADRAYVSDFGVARSLAGNGLTQTGAVVGTLDYLSPEQARGEEVDGRTDLYALGVLLFEMLSGQLPFAAGSTGEMLAQRIGGSPRDLSEAGPAAAAVAATAPPLAAIVRRCLEREPQRRYANARELAADLDRLTGSGAGTTGAAVGPAAAPSPRRRVLWAAVAAGVLVVVVAAGWWFARGRLGDERGMGGPAGGAAAAPRHAVAVLPLADETGDPGLAWTSRGLAETLAAALAESPSLRVVEPLRLFQILADLKLPAGPLPERELRRVAELVEVDRLVVGRVRAMGTQVRLDLELVKVEAEAVETVPLPARDAAPAALFSSLADLGGALRERLEVAPPERAPRPLSSSPAALSAYGEGVERLLQGDVVGAAPALERATVADPEFTAAWVRLAGAYQALGYGDKALAAARRAVATLGASDDRMANEARAREALLRGEPERAAEVLTRLVARYPNDAEAQIALAEAQAQRGDLGAAVAVLEQVVALDPSHPRAWYELARYSILAGDSRRAIDDYLVRAMVIQNRVGSRQGRADVVNALGVAHNQLGELPAAAEQFEKAAALRREIGDDRGYATSLRNLASIEATRGQHEQARSHLAQALALLEKIGDRAGVADLTNALGFLDEEEGRYASALELFRRALQIRRDLGAQGPLAESFNNVGYAYYLQGEYDNAMVYWRQALDLYRDKDDRPGIVLTTQSIGFLDLAQGRWDAALKSFLAALDGSRELEMKKATAVSLGHLGRVAQFQGRYRAARTSYGEALAIVTELGDTRGMAEFALFEADAMLELGLLGEAKERLDAAAERLAKSPNREQGAELLRLRGEWALARGDLAGAGRDFTAARREAETSQSVVAVLAARLGGARLLLARGAAERAAAELRPLAEETDRLGNARLRLVAGELLAQAELAAGRPAAAAAVAERALRLAADVGSYAGAYRLHALAGRVLAAQGDGAGAARERAEAERELARLREDLTPDEQRAFAVLTEGEDGVKPRDAS